MSQEEVERILWPEKPSGLEPEKLKTLIRAAIPAYLSLLREVDIELFDRRIFRLQEDKIKGFTIDFPWYGLASPHDVTGKSLQCQDIKAAIDYVLDDGGLRKKISPVRILDEAIHNPLSRILEEAAIDEAVDTGDVTLWRLPDYVLERSLDEIIQRVVHHKYTYLAICPLGFVEGNPGSSWSLDENVSIKLYSPEDRVRYLSRHYDKLSRHDFMSHFDLGNAAVLEIAGSMDDTILRRGIPPRSGDEILHEEIADTIDMAKWALMIGFGHSNPLIEATITYQDILGMEYLHYGTGPFGIGSFRRQFEWAGVVYDLDAVKMRKVATLFQNARTIWGNSEDIRDAFWYWGRSCVASLDRDMLLDSVIGLETLLLPQERVELSYRFKLHGAALLARSEEEAEKKFLELGDIYNIRSRAAHGSRMETKKEKARKARKNLKEKVLKARKNLAEAIASVIELCEQSVLEPTDNISKQIGKIVRRKCHLRIKVTPETNPDN